MTYQEVLDYHTEHGKLPDNFCGLTYSKKDVLKRSEIEYKWNIPNSQIVIVITDENKAIIIESNEKES